MTRIRQIFSQPITDIRSLLLLALLLLVVVLMPEIPPGDWNLNAKPLTTGLQLYENPNYVFPPWVLLLFWPYYFANVIGTRIAFVLSAAFLAYRRSWSVGRFMLIVLCPIFLYSVAFNNVDLLVLALPLVLWDFVREKQWAWIAWGILFAVMLLKPQGALIAIPYLLWQERQRWPELVRAISLTSLIILPISLVGSPPLLLQWLDNIRFPSAQNQLYWGENNLSLNTKFGFSIALALITLGIVSLYSLMRWRGKTWAKHHTWGTLIFVSMFLAPYASSQSMIAPFAFVPSWQAYLLQVLYFAFPKAIEQSPIPAQVWFFLLALLALYFAPTQKDVVAVDAAKQSQVDTDLA